MKPALSPHTTGFLPSCLHQRGDVLEHARLGDDGPDDLDEALHRCRVEEVHADHATRARVGRRDLGDRERRGVGGQDGVLGDDPVELLEDLLLDLQRLHDRLDDEVGVLELLDRRGEADPVVQRLRLVLAELAARDRAGGGVLEVLTAAGDAVVVDLHADDGVAVAGEHLRDPGTHGAQSDNADGLEVTCHGPHPATGPGGPDCVSDHSSRQRRSLQSRCSPCRRPLAAVVRHACPEDRHPRGVERPVPSVFPEALLT